MVRNYLDIKFPKRLSRRKSPVAQPVRSPDLIPLEFFLFGYVRVNFFSVPIQSLSCFKEDIKQVVRDINTDTLEKLCKSTKSRTD